MTDKTRVELVRAAMQILVPLADNSHSAADLATVDSFVEPLIEALNKEGVTYLGDTDAYPPEQFLYLARLLADAAMQNFGAAVMPQAPPEISKKLLRTMNAGTPGYSVLAGEYM